MKLTLKEFIQKEVGASYDMDTIFFNLESDQVLEIIESYAKYVNSSPYKKKLYGYAIEFKTVFIDKKSCKETTVWTNYRNKIYDNKFIAQEAINNICRDSDLFRYNESRIVCLHFF